MIARAKGRGRPKFPRPSFFLLVLLLRKKQRLLRRKEGCRDSFCRIRVVESSLRKPICRSLRSDLLQNIAAALENQLEIFIRFSSPSPRCCIANSAAGCLPSLPSSEDIWRFPGYDLSDQREKGGEGDAPFSIERRFRISPSFILAHCIRESTTAPWE